MSESKEVLFDLACPRSVAISDRGRTYRLKCRPITVDDWQAYFAGIVITSENVGKDRVSVIDVNTPRLALAEAVLVIAHGYKVEGGVEIQSLPGWQRKIPLAHRLLLGETLADVRPSSSEDLFLSVEGEVVMLDATYTAIAEEKDGRAVRYSMQKIQGLKHVLKTPTEDEYRRFARESSRSKVVGGSRTGKTIYKGAQQLLADLYDELIVSVDGYSVAGIPLTTDVYSIRVNMDMLHKVMAAQELFQPQASASLTGGDEE